MKNTRRPSCIFRFLVFLLFVNNGWAQHYPLRFQHLSVEQGLSHNQVTSITQDKNGVVWFGTADGVNRFDGYKVDVYRHESGNKESLPDNMVRCLFTDSRGIVWIGTSHGLACYDAHTNSFRSFFQNATNRNSLPGNWISTINEDMTGILWIGTTTGLCSFDVMGNRFQRFLHQEYSNSISNNDINDIKFSPDGTMWIATSNGLNRLNVSSRQFTAFFHDPSDSSTLSGNSLSRLAIDQNGNLWTYLSNTLRLECFNTQTHRCRHFTNFIERQSDVSSNYFRSILVDRSGKLWIGTNAAGLALFVPDKNSFYEYRPDPFNQYGLQGYTILQIYQDRSDLIWVGTASAGVERFNPKKSKFIHYQTPATAFPALTHQWVRAVAEDSLHQLWIGSLNGVSILNRSTGAYINYQWKQGDHHSLSDNSVRALCCDSRGDMWVGTPNGLNLFDPKHKNFRVFYGDNNNRSLAGSNVSSIISNKNGDLLIGGAGGLSIYNVKTRGFTNFKNDSAHALLRSSIAVIFEDSRSMIWIGTGRNGLIRYDPVIDEVSHFTNTVNDSNSLASDYVCSITEDRKGIIWVGTASGLCRLNEATRNFTTFSERNGLPNVHVAQLLVDDKNQLWMSTNKGLSMLNGSRTKFTNYDPSDGLQGWEFNDQSAFKTHDGYFCYCGKNGFNMFHPDSLTNNPFVPPVILKRIMIFDKLLSIDSLYAGLHSIKLSYKQNFFSFEFAALNYDHPEKNQYACQLIGFDKKMLLLGTNRVVSYTNVPPGHYKLKVKGSNDDGVWNEAGYELSVVITPPFWATWWFRTGAIAVCVSIIFLLFKLRESRLKKEQAHQTLINKQIAEIKMTALRAQMNPHFIFNSLNSVQHFVTIREKEEALNYLSKFSKLIRQILENSRENTVVLRNELQLLELYIQLEQLRFNNKFHYHIDVDENVDTDNTEIPPLLIQPYIENAILHGLVNKEGKGDLWVSLQRSNGLLVCKIEDNGIGRANARDIQRKKTARHKSLGIEVTNERVSTLFSLLDYKLDVLVEDLFESKNGSIEPQPAGTRVTISIPLKEED